MYLLYLVRLIISDRLFEERPLLYYIIL